MDTRLGAFLRQLRGKRSLREISEISGLSHTYIRELELGYKQNSKKPIHPSLEALKQLADAYEYSYEEILKLAGYNPSKILDNSLIHSDYSESIFENPNDLLEVLNKDAPLFVGNKALTTNDKQKIIQFLKLFF